MLDILDICAAKKELTSRSVFILSGGDWIVSLDEIARLFPFTLMNSPRVLYSIKVQRS